MKKRVVITLVAIVAIAGIAYAVSGGDAREEIEAAARPFFVPVIVTPSIQLVNGQVLLYKATNLSRSEASLRLMLFNDEEAVPALIKDFLTIPAGKTISYVYDPPKGTLTLGETTVTAPAAVHATFAPIPGDDPGVMRRFVANVQIMRVQNSGGTPTLDPPIPVTLVHCNFEPRGLFPYTGARFDWNCAPDMFPLDARWRTPTLTGSQERAQEALAGKTRQK